MKIKLVNRKGEFVGMGYMDLSPYGISDNQTEETTVVLTDEQEEILKMLKRQNLADNISIIKGEKELDI